MFFVKFIYQGEEPVLATHHNGDLMEFPTWEMANAYGQNERNAIYKALVKPTHTAEELQEIIKLYVPKYEIIFRAVREEE